MFGKQENKAKCVNKVFNKCTGFRRSLFLIIFFYFFICLSECFRFRFCSQLLQFLPCISVLRISRANFFCNFVNKANEQKKEEEREEYQDLGSSKLLCNVLKVSFVWFVAVFIKHGGTIITRKCWPLLLFASVALRLGMCGRRIIGKAIASNLNVFIQMTSILDPIMLPNLIA